MMPNPENIEQAQLKIEPSEQNSINIIIRSLSGEDMTVNVEQAATVWQLMCKISELFNELTLIPSDQYEEQR